MKDKWSGSNSRIKVVSVEADPKVAQSLAVVVNFETVAQAIKEPRSEVMAEIDVIMAKREYTLDFCLSVSTSLSEVPDRSINVFMRQKRYPFKKLTTAAQVSAAKPCSQVKLNTINSLLFFNIRDYANLVFDFTDYVNAESDSNGFKVEITGFKMESSEMDVPKKPEDKIVEKPVENWVSIIEGWASKYTAANIGFGIAIAILIIAILALCFLFQLNYRKI
jgi:hypothetical protein